MLVVPHAIATLPMADPFEDGPYDQDREEPEVRCLLCGERMLEWEYEVHECDIEPFERIR